MERAFAYIASNNITSLLSYPYKGVNQACLKKGGNYKIIRYITPPRMDCAAFLTVIKSRPTTAAVDAGSTAWQLYKTGVLCTYNKNLNHAILRNIGNRSLSKFFKQQLLDFKKFLGN